MNSIYEPKRPQGSHPVYEVETHDPINGKFVHEKVRPNGYVLGELSHARVRFSEKTKLDFGWNDANE